MELHVYESVDKVITALADFFVQNVNDVIKEKGNCDMVLSGGNSPKKLYELLASDKYYKKIQWENIFFFFGDERYLPFSDESNNGHMAKQALFNPLHIDPSNIFYINTSLQPNKSAEDYSHRIREHFGNKKPAFDFILLGLGDNAHTASLFPHTTVLNEKTNLVSAPFIEELSAFRITMTAPLINIAGTIAFLVYGDSKAKAVYSILKGEKNTDMYPAQLINNEKGNEHWFLDQEAAKYLNNH